MKKFLEELEKLDNGLYRIRETIDVNYSKVSKVPIKEEKILVEGRETTPSKIGYRFKIWNSDPTEKGFNYNGRNYSKVIPLAIEQNLSTICLMNHPEDDGDVRNICGVARDARLDDDGWMSTLFIPCGEYGKLISDVIEAGGPISVSSSILGELDDDNYVKPEGVIIERFLDVIMSGQASNGLNHYKNKIEFQNDDGSRDTIEEGDITEITENSTSNSKLTISGNNENLIEKGDNTEMADKLVETSMKMNINAMIKDADKKENLYERKDSLVEALNYAKELTDKSLAENIQEKVDKVEEELKVLSEKGLKADELTDSVKELTESKTQLEEEIKLMSKEKEKLASQVETVTKLYEEKQYKASETEINRSQSLAKEVCTLKLESKNKDIKIQKLLHENKKLKDGLEKAEALANTKVDADDYAELQESVDELVSKNNFLMKSLHEAKRELKTTKRNQKSRFTYVKEALNNRTNNKNNILESRMIDSTNKNNGSSIMEDDPEDIKMEKMLNK